MTFTTSKAQVVRPRLQELCSRLNLDTRKVSVSVSTRNEYPYCLRAKIFLPTIGGCGGWEAFARSFLHELSHAQDYLQGVDLGYDAAEAKARRFERFYDASTQTEEAETFACEGCGSETPNRPVEVAVKVCDGYDVADIAICDTCAAAAEAEMARAGFGL